MHLTFLLSFYDYFTEGTPSQKKTFVAPIPSLSIKEIEKLIHIWQQQVWWFCRKCCFQILFLVIQILVLFYKYSCIYFTLIYYTVLLIFTFRNIQLNSISAFYIFWIFLFSMENWLLGCVIIWEVHAIFLMIK